MSNIYELANPPEWSASTIHHLDEDGLGFEYTSKITELENVAVYAQRLDMSNDRGDIAPGDARIVVEAIGDGVIDLTISQARALLEVLPMTLDRFDGKVTS